MVALLQLIQELTAGNDQHITADQKRRCLVPVERKAILTDSLEFALLEVCAHQGDVVNLAIRRAEEGTKFRVETSHQSFAHSSVVHAVAALPKAGKNIFGILKDSAFRTRSC